MVNDNEYKIITSKDSPCLPGFPNAIKCPDGRCLKYVEDITDEFMELMKEREYYRKRMREYQCKWNWKLTEAIQLKELINELGTKKMKKRMKIICGEEEI